MLIVLIVSVTDTVTNRESPFATIQVGFQASGLYEGEERGVLSRYPGALMHRIFGSAGRLTSDIIVL